MLGSILYVFLTKGITFLCAIIMCNVVVVFFVFVVFVVRFLCDAYGDLGNVFALIRNIEPLGMRV